MKGLPILLHRLTHNFQVRMYNGETKKKKKKKREQWLKEHTISIKIIMKID